MKGQFFYKQIAVKIKNINFSLKVSGENLVQIMWAKICTIGTQGMESAFSKINKVRKNQLYTRKSIRNLIIINYKCNNSTRKQILGLADLVTYFFTEVDVITMFKQNITIPRQHCRITYDPYASNKNL